MTSRNRRLPTTLCLLGLLVAALMLSACGGGSKPAASTGTVSTPAAGSSSSAASGPASRGFTTPRSAAAKPAAAARTRFNKALAAFSSCLRSNGVSFPPARVGATPSLKGVDTKSPAYEAAATKCSPALNAALRPAEQSTTGAGPEAQTSRSRAAAPTLPISAALLAQEKRFSACMRTHGVAGFPEPKAGGGWALAGAHLNTSNPQFRTAESSCSSILDPHNPRG